MVYTLFNCGKNIIKAYKNKQAANKNFKNIKTYVKKERAGTNVAQNELVEIYSGQKKLQKKAKLAPRLECSHNGIILIVNCSKLYGKPINAYYIIAP